MSEKSSDWQSYALLLAIYLLIFFVFGFNPLAYIMIGFWIGAIWFRGVGRYFESSLAKIKEKQKSRQVKSEWLTSFFCCANTNSKNIKLFLKK